MIPNTIHFIYTGGKPFSLIHYLAIKSAWVVNRPSRIFFHYSQKPQGEWWEKAVPYLHPLEIAAPQEVAGVPLHIHEHQVDLARLKILQEYGGIYLDIDVICVKPFTPLLRHVCVLGEQGINGERGLCNAVILAEPGAPFLQRWLDGFDPETSLWSGFRSQGYDEHWDEMSVKYPMYLAQHFPDEVCIQGYKKFYWPCFYPVHLEIFFTKKGYAFPEAYCIHLWESMSWPRYLRNMTLQDLRTADTNFTRIVGRFLNED